MRHKLWFLFLILVLAGVYFGAPALSQPDTRSRLPWAVWRLGDDSAEIVAAFESAKDAAADCQRRSTDSDPQRYSYLTRKEKMNPEGAKSLSVAGRRGQGKIGAHKVTFEFRGQEVFIGGDLEGSGKWTQTDTGAITIETALSIFRGLVDGDSVYGLRLGKDASQPIIEWSIVLEPAAAAKIDGEDGHLEVQQITAAEINAFAGEKGKAVIGSLPGNGEQEQLVTAVPGSKDRVWDGTTLGGLKDLADGKKVEDEVAIDKIGLFIREQFPKEDAALKETADNLRVKLLDLGESPMEVELKVQETVRTETKNYLQESTPEQKQELFQRYADRGAPVHHTFRPADMRKVQWFQVPTKTDLRTTVKNYERPKATSTQPTITTGPKTSAGPSSSKAPGKDDFIQKIFHPHVVFDDTQKKPGTVASTKPGAKEPSNPNKEPRPTADLAKKSPPANPIAKTQPGIVPMPKPNQGVPKTQPPPVPVNNLGSALQKLSENSKKTAAPTTRTAPIQRPPEPPRAPIFVPQPRERKVEPKPGGVIITATAEIQGLKPEDVLSAAFDQATGVLTLRLRSGAAVTCKLDADDFAVAIRSIYGRQVDPSLSMSFGEKVGYKSVTYSGPLFKTKFGKTLLETDELLGDLIFNREGDHRLVAAGIIKNYEEMVCESDRTMTLGSRVFLRASGARFVLKDGRLVCRDIKTKVDVEGSGYAAGYYQESLHRLARDLDKNFGPLAENFSEFQKFRDLVQCVALTKWLKRHAIAFDADALQTRKVAEHDIPALIPAAQWSCLFNGRNLDGWRTNLPARALAWSAESGAVKLKPTGAAPLTMLMGTYWQDYDLRYTVVTEGPVEFFIRNGSGPAGASVTIDTKGRPQKVELFLTKGAWTAIAPGFGKEGALTLPESKKNETLQPNDFGIRVPAGSTVTLYTASLRTR